MVAAGVLYCIFVFALQHLHHKDKQAVSRRRYLLTVFGSIMYRYVLRQSESVPAVLMVPML